ncbi:MAG: UDP-GlcNAc--UDP-phosphate GlcNAc-1-phosphate transferase [Bacteroidota bacterium]
MKNIDYIIVFAGLFILEWLYVKLAQRTGIVDRPNHRTMHSGNIARGGGVIFPVAYIVYYLWSGSEEAYLLAGLILISVISYSDDLRSIPGFVRLPLQFLSVFLMFTQLEVLNEWTWPLALLSLIISAGILNAFNFMDGINGITAVYSASVLGILAVVQMFIIRFIDTDLIMVMLLSLAVFSFFNFRKKAVCFTGDVGSVSIGFIITYLILKLILVTGSFIWVLLLLVYGLDVVITLLQRLKRGDNIFDAHRLHLFQLIVANLKLSHLKVSVLFTLVQVAISSFVIGIYILAPSAQLLFSVLILALGTGIYLFLKARITGSVWLPEKY